MVHDVASRRPPRLLYIMLLGGYFAHVCLCIRVSLSTLQPQQEHEHKALTVAEMRLSGFLFVSLLLEGLFISGKG